jgi:hypothetical protein
MSYTGYCLAMSARASDTGTCKPVPGREREQKAREDKDEDEDVGSPSVAPQAICDLFGSSADAPILNYTPVLWLNSWTTSHIQSPTKPKRVFLSRYARFCHPTCCRHGNSYFTVVVSDGGVQSVHVWRYRVSGCCQLT